MESKKTVLLALTAALSLTGASLTSGHTVDRSLDIYLKPETLVELPDHRHIHLFCKGQGRPVAIVAPGWHIPALGWNRIQPLMAKETRVCIYDRAGYSFSDPGPLPRDTEAEVKDLHEALVASGNMGPFILVGHSLGGFDARLFAYTYPKDTAGLLLLDPPDEHKYQHLREPDEDVALYRKCASLVRRKPLRWGSKCLDISLGPRWSSAMKSKVLADQNKASWYDTIVSEDVSMVTRSSDEILRAEKSLKAIPIIVLQADTDCSMNTASRSSMNAGDQERCADLLRQAQDSTQGERRIVAGASHMVQDDKPEVVLDAFKQVVEAARTSGLATAAGRN